MSKRAWVTLATNDSYGLGALVLAHSLRRTGSVYPAVVLITPSVTQPMRDRLNAVFAEVIIVDVLDSKDAAHLALLQRPELGITFTKIHCWNLTQYEKCVFLDADTLVVQNSDELFERVELSAAPDVGWPDCFNSGVFVFQPSPDTFEKLIKFAQERGSFDGGDQGLLNSFFSDWAHGDINKHLPFVYNVTSAAFYSYLPALKHYGQNLKIIHFIGAGKPWLQQYNWEAGSVEAPEHLREFLQLWWDLFVANVHAQLDVSMVKVEEAPCELPELPPQDVFRYYEPMIDPDSEFPWHHPDSQSHDEEFDTAGLDMTQFHDPWELYRGNFSAKADCCNDSLHLETNKENNSDVKKHYWEHSFPQEDNKQISTQESIAQNNFKSEQLQRFHEFSHHDKHQHEQQVYHSHIHHQHNHSYSSIKLDFQPYNEGEPEYHSHIYNSHNNSYQSNEIQNKQQNLEHQPFKHDELYGQQSHIHFEHDNHVFPSHEYYNQLDKNNIRDQQREHHLHIHDQQHKHHDYWEENSTSQNLHEFHHNSTQHDHLKQISNNNNVSLVNHINSHHPSNNCIPQNIDESLSNKNIPQTISATYHLEHKQKQPVYTQTYQVQMDHFGTHTHHAKGSSLNGDLLEDDNEYQEFIIPRHPYDGYYLRHRATVDSRGHKICSHVLLLQPSTPPEDCTTPMELLSGDRKDQSGVAGNLARVVPGTTGFQREALDELTRRQGWEAGNIDYMGADSFDNIWAKISQTLSQPRSSSPKQSPPRESSTPQKQPSPIKESPSQPQKAEDGSNTTQESVTLPIETAQEAVVLDAAVTSAAAVVSDSDLLVDSNIDVTLKEETLVKTPPETVATESTPGTDDVQTSEAVTESLTKDEITVETKPVVEVPLAQEIVTKETSPKVDIPLAGQTCTSQETSAPIDKESIVLEKDVALDTSVPTPESLVSVIDTSAPIEPNATVVETSPVQAAVPVSAELPVSKEQISSQVIETPVVESEIQVKPVTVETSAHSEVKVLDVTEAAPLATIEGTILAQSTVLSAVESPESILINETASKEVPLIDTPSLVTTSTSVEVATPAEAKAEVSETLEAQPSEAITSQTSVKSADAPVSVDTLPSETVAKTEDDKPAIIPKEETSKKIDMSKIPHTPPTTPKSTPEATTPVAETVLKTDPLDTTQKIAAAPITKVIKDQKIIDTPIVTPASPVSTDISSPIASVVESTPEKPSEALEATDSPPLANTPSKEEAPALPAAKSTEEAAQETRL